MNYLKIKWQHQHLDEPIEIYSEVDSNRWETRKVEVFANGKRTFASSGNDTGSTRLGETPLPDLVDINRDPQFEGQMISRHEFEQIWQASIHQNGDAQRESYDRQC